MFFENILAPACSLCGLDVHPTARSLPVAGAVFSLLALIQMDQPRAPDCSWGTSSRPGTQNRSIVCAKSCDSSVRTASATPSISGCYVAALPRRSRLSSASGPWLRCVVEWRHQTAAGQGKMAAISLLIDQNHANVVLADVPPRERLADWRIRHNQTAFVIFVDLANEEDSLDALYAGARAILPRTAKPDEIVTVIKAVTNGLAVLPGELLPTLLSGASLVGELLDDNDADRARLTPRELEVLAAMADGISNKAIARRLGISFHTAKFHVAAILAKLNADSRTEAVARAAQLGLVML